MPISHASNVKFPMLKIIQARFQQYMNQELPDKQTGFRRGRNGRSNCQHPLDHRKDKGIPKKKNLLLFHWLPKVFDGIGHNKLWKILKEMWIPGSLTYLLETCIQGNKQQLELDMEQLAGSKLGKECDKTLYCHPTYLTYMQSISCEKPGWMSKTWNQDC